jgi:hypothetical protein
MDRIDDSSEVDYWVVHVGVKIWGTVVWETVVGLFQSEDRAKQWEFNLMRFVDPGRADFSTLVMPLITDIPEPVKLAHDLNQEVVEFVQGLESESDKKLDVPELTSAEKVANNAYLVKAHNIGLFIQEIKKKGIIIQQVFDQYFAQVLIVVDLEKEKQEEV